jgi:hypothetical protein
MRLPGACLRYALVELLQLQWLVDLTKNDSTASHGFSPLRQVGGRQFLAMTTRRRAAR